MIRIALCDDSPEYSQRTAAQLEQWSVQRGVNILLDTYDNGDALLNALSRRNYDLIFLDIIMPMLSGIDTCMEIRKENRQTKIIFLSVSPEFGVDAFRVKANGYLLKSQNTERLFEVLDEHLAESVDNSDFIVAKTLTMVKKVPLSSIRHIEAQNKQVLIYTSDGDVVTSSTPLHQIAAELKMPCFFQCHRSYIVNMNFISSYTKSEIVTDGGQHIPISRNFAKEFQSTYFSFLFGKAGDI